MLEGLGPPREAGLDPECGGGSLSCDIGSRAVV